MSYRFRAGVLFVAMLWPAQALPQAPQPAQHTYVIVHGAWGGGWDWRRVDSILTTLGQDTVQVPRGTRLRVTAARLQPSVQTGTYQALTDTTLLLSSRSTTVTIPLATITQLEQSRGRKPSIVGGVVGFLIGGAAGGVLACAANRDDYGVFCGGQDDTKLYVGAALGGVAGAVLGALLFRKERWRAVDIDQLRSARPDR